jgi:exodeoxyribonuclease V gamma subunit
MLQIRFANRFEALLDALQGALGETPASPFVPVEVIVPSAAIRRRIELATAERFGVCANVEFPFLAQWLWRQIGHLVDVGETSPFSAPVLAWRVLALLGEPQTVAAHPPLARYLQDADDVMRFELAARIAGLLEQYLTYRPDWLAVWLAGKAVRIDGLDAAREADARWQGALWRRIATDLGADARHPSLAFFEAMAKLGPEAPARAGLPAVAHVFCLPAMPPLYLDILRGLAQWIDLRLYVLNPCREYWLEAVDPKRLAYLVARGRADHHEVGNRLLAAWGRQTQAHIDLLLQDDGATIDDADFAPAQGATLLAQVQNAILEFRDIAPGSLALAEDDRSIEVHVCHSLTRELEALQDQLLAMFAGARPPRPCDVVVVTPDLESAAPLIDAVFGNVPQPRFIPYTITGRPARMRNPCAQALLAVFDVAVSRFAASAVFELLQKPIIARRFGIGDAQLASIHDWIRESGIRWGIDSHHRAELGLPPTDRHSFSDGLDRLYLGYALPAFAAQPLRDRLGAGNAEGSAALALGSFAEFVRQLVRLHGELGRPQVPDAWRSLLLAILDAFTAPEHDEVDDARETAAAIGQLHLEMTQGGMRSALPADIVRAALERALDEPTRGGVPGGAVTFAAMASLRSLPYRIVCVLGLNDGAFPSPQRTPDFDLMAQPKAQRRGDRQRRLDDRNVFLDLLLAARERLYLSYTGRSVRDNAPLPPSVLVSELLDYLAAVRARLVVAHPLQPFSVDYFKPGRDTRLRSFNDEYCEALRRQLAAQAVAAMTASGVSDATTTTAAAAAMSAEAARIAEPSEDGDEDEEDRMPRQNFFPSPLPAPGPEFRDVTLDGLVRFFRNPCRQLLRLRLGIVLPKGDEELGDDEPFVADRCARDALAARVLPRLLAGDGTTELRACARAGIEYPPGRLGDLELDRELAHLRVFAEGLAPALAPPPLEPFAAGLEFTIHGEAWRLDGSFGDLRTTGLVRYRYDDTHPHDYLAAWIAHLFLNGTAPPGAATTTAWHSRDGAFVLRPLADARERLAALLERYRAGLMLPLRFFPKAAWAYATNGHSLAKARGAWSSSSFRPFGEDRDPAYRVALRGVDDPLDAEFETCAAAVFDPLLAAIDDARLGSPA